MKSRHPILILCGLVLVMLAAGCTTGPQTNATAVPTTGPDRNRKSAPTAVAGNMISITSDGRT